MFRHCSRSISAFSSCWPAPRQVCLHPVRRLCAIRQEQASQLLKAFDWEEDHGFQNSQGRSNVFSEFARRSMIDLEVPLEYEKHTQVVMNGLTHYDSLDTSARQTIVKTYRQLLLVLHDSPAEINEKSRRELDRESFAMAAESSFSSEDSSDDDNKSLKQGSEKWLAFRKKRLTASAFSRVLGMFATDPHNDMSDLWLEKLGLKEPFKGNKLTAWGLKMEPVARGVYCRLTGHRVEPHGIEVLGNHPAENWLAASPDGLIEAYDQSGNFHQFPDAARDLLLPGTSSGVLEVKCPYGGWYGPSNASPPEIMAHYYMPQVQGQMEIFDREWCHLFYWTQEKGTKVFLVQRNREYWSELYELLATFWWEHVIPARNCLEQNASSEEYLDFKPRLETIELVEKSKRLAEKAESIKFSATDHFIG